MGQQFRNTVNGDIRTVSGPVADHYDSKPGWERVESIAVGDLKGDTLDAALRDNGLPTTGKVAEKKARLAEHLANGANTAGVPAGPAGHLNPDAVIAPVPSQD